MAAPWRGGPRSPPDPPEWCRDHARRPHRPAPQVAARRGRHRARGRARGAALPGLLAARPVAGRRRGVPRGGGLPPHRPPGLRHAHGGPAAAAVHLPTLRRGARPPPGDDAVRRGRVVVDRAAGARDHRHRLVRRVPADPPRRCVDAARPRPAHRPDAVAAPGERRHPVRAGQRVHGAGLPDGPARAAPRAGAPGAWGGALQDPARLGPNMGTSNQSIRGFLLRVGPDGMPGTLLWLVCVAGVGVFGFWLARRLFLAGDTIGEVAAVGLMACLLSPVAWIHHFHWVVVVIFALLGADPLRDRRRLWAGLGVTAFFLCRLPWWGISWLNHRDWPELPGRVLQNADVVGALAALVLLWWVTRPCAGTADGAEPEADAQSTPAISSPV